MFSIRTPLLLCALILSAPAFAGRDTRHDTAMTTLATKAGCLTCHSVHTTSDSSETPIGPAWQDVAARYHGQKGAAAQLAQTVQDGSNPYQAHWKNKATGLAMPPNAVAINKTDTRKLVDWILTLDQ